MTETERRDALKAYFKSLPLKMQRLVARAYRSAFQAAAFGVKPEMWVKDRAGAFKRIDPNTIVDAFEGGL